MTFKIQPNGQPLPPWPRGLLPPSGKAWLEGKHSINQGAKGVAVLLISRPSVRFHILYHAER